jgi:hypothetical protein
MCDLLLPIPIAGCRSCVHRSVQDRSGWEIEARA